MFVRVAHFGNGGVSESAWILNHISLTHIARRIRTSQVHLTTSPCWLVCVGRRMCLWKSRRSFLPRAKICWPNCMMRPRMGTRPNWSDLPTR